MMHEQYERERQQDLDKGDVCPLCDAETITAFTHWRIIPNRYPYDAVAEKHDQLVPRRHTDGNDLTEAELAELKQLKATSLNEAYTFVIEALPSTKSIPGHFHLHLMVPKVVN